MGWRHGSCRGPRPDLLGQQEVLGRAAFLLLIAILVSACNQNGEDALGDALDMPGGLGRAVAG
jgi:hypothetical protein